MRSFRVDIEGGSEYGAAEIGEMVIDGFAVPPATVTAVEVDPRANDVVFVLDSEGWAGLYVGGRLKLQGDHGDLSGVDRAIEALGIEARTYNPAEPPEDQRGDGFPDEIGDLLMWEVS